MPAELVGTENERGQTIPDKIYPVFRDEESLPADADLGLTISKALDRSQFLVCLCSPRAVESKYVAQEIDHFKNARKEDRIIAAILAGEPGHAKDECFPSPIREIATPDGKVKETIAADFRLPDGTEGFTSPEAYRKTLLDQRIPPKTAKKLANTYGDRLQLMKLKVIAGILGLPLETLRNRDQAYQLQRAEKRQRILTGIVGIVSLLAVATMLAGIYANMQRKNAFEAAQAEKEARIKTEQALEANQKALLYIKETFQTVQSYVPHDKRLEILAWLDTATVELNLLDETKNTPDSYKKYWQVREALLLLRQKITEHPASKNGIKACLDNLLEAEKIYSSIPQVHLNEVQKRHLLIDEVRLLIDRASILILDQRYAGTLSKMQEIEDQLQRLSKKFPDEQALEELKTFYYQILIQLYAPGTGIGTPEDLLTYQDKAITHLEKLSDNTVDKKVNAFGLSSYYFTKASTLIQLGRIEEGLKLSQEKFIEIEKNLDDDPLNRHWINLFVHCASMRMSHLYILNDVKEIQRINLKLCHTLENFHQFDPNNPNLPRILLESYMSSASSFLDTQDVKSCIEYSHKALTLSLEEHLFSEDLRVKTRFSCYIMLCRAHAANSNMPEARTSLTLAGEIFETDRDNILRDVANEYLSLKSFYLSLDGEYDLALNYANQAIDSIKNANLDRAPSNYLLSEALKHKKILRKVMDAPGSELLQIQDEIDEREDELKKMGFPIQSVK